MTESETVSEQSYQLEGRSEVIGRVRPAVQSLVGYRPGKANEQVEREHGISDSIKLASNENPWPPIEPVAGAIRAAVDQVNRYGDNDAVEVRDAIATWQKVPVDNVAVGCGSSGLLQQIFMTFVSPGDEVVFPWHSFEIYPVFCTLFDAVAVKVPLVDYAFDLNAIAAAVTDQTSVIFLATPNNPTGSSISMADVSAMLERLGPDVIVVIDEAYREFNDPRFGDPVIDVQPEHPNVVVTRTFSKAFGLAGLRSGYCIAHPDVITEINKTRLPFSVNNLAQAGMIAAIDHVDAAMAQVDELVAERTRCIARLNDAGISTTETHANFVFIPTGPQTMTLASDLEAAGVITRPFADLGLRVTVGSRDQNDRWVDALIGLHGAGH